ncbi:hypothetical protein M8C21_029644, partial [Ambrosia artemisiifolia]
MSSYPQPTTSSTDHHHHHRHRSSLSYPFLSSSSLSANPLIFLKGGLSQNRLQHNQTLHLIFSSPPSPHNHLMIVVVCIRLCSRRVNMASKGLREQDLSSGIASAFYR